MASVCGCGPALAVQSCRLVAVRAGQNSAFKALEVLPARSRLRNRTLLRTTVRRGARSGRRCLVVHFLAADATSQDGTTEPAKVGFAVSKAVGGSVVRHRVTRRLRHVVAAHLAELPAGSNVVVRALPPSADATSAELEADFATAISRVSVCA